MATRLLVAMALLLAQTPLLPAMFALVAWADGSHAVSIRSTGAGVSVVLTHPGDQFQRASHYHGTFLRLLCHAAEDAPHQDHEFSFAASACGERASRLLLPHAAALVAIIPAVREASSARAVVASAADDTGLPQERDAGLHSWLQHRLRSVELVI